jgi:hypothetical protein
LPLLREEKLKTKNMNLCNGHPLRPGNGICIYFYKISDICLIVGEAAGTWEIKGNCGVKWDTMLKNSSDHMQEIPFYDYPIKIQVRSEHDPHVKFGLRTDGQF